MICIFPGRHRSFIKTLILPPQKKNQLKKWNTIIIVIPIVSGESFAELHHGNDAEILLPAARWYLILLILFNIIITIQNRRR